MNFKTIWDKLAAWFAGEISAAEVEFSKDEKAILAFIRPLLASTEASALQDLITFIIAVLSQAKTAQDLPTWETAVLMGLESTGSELFGLAQGLGSNLLQALIGFALAKLPASHPAVAA